MKNLCFAFALLPSIATFAATTVTVDSMSRDESTGLVTVGYTLSGESAVVTFGAETNSVPLPDAAFRRVSGDVNRMVAAGSHTVSWYPEDSFPGGVFAAEGFKAVVKAWPKNSPPDYLVIDLLLKTTAYYTCAEVIPGGVTDRRYVTDQIVFRRIPAAGVTWRMGSPTDEVGRDADEATRYVQLDADYYMAVFETTHRQSKLLFDQGPTYLWNAYDYGNPEKENDVLPLNCVAYSALRGNHSGDGAVYWPKDGHTVTAGLLKVGRDKYGFAFDLPTEAQWEFACRAGEPAAFCNGASLRSNPPGPQIDEIAWHIGNSTNDELGIAFPHRPGLLKPNGFGLYDMLGNVAEYCLDGYAAFVQDMADPTAVISNPQGAGIDPSGTVVRSVRGGGFSCTAANCRSSSRFGQQTGWDMSTEFYNVNIPASGMIPAMYKSFVGVRLCLPAEAVK